MDSETDGGQPATKRAKLSHTAQEQVQPKQEPATVQDEPSADAHTAPQQAELAPEVAAESSALPGTTATPAELIAQLSQFIAEQANRGSAAGTADLPQVPPLLANGAAADAGPLADANQPQAQTDTTAPTTSAAPNLLQSLQLPPHNSHLLPPVTATVDMSAPPSTGPLPPLALSPAGLPQGAASQPHDMLSIMLLLAATSAAQAALPQAQPPPAAPGPLSLLNLLSAPSGAPLRLPGAQLQSDGDTSVGHPGAGDTGPGGVPSLLQQLAGIPGTMGGGVGGPSWPGAAGGALPGMGAGAEGDSQRQALAQIMAGTSSGGGGGRGEGRNVGEVGESAMITSDGQLVTNSKVEFADRGLKLNDGRIYVSLPFVHKNFPEAEFPINMNAELVIDDEVLNQVCPIKIARSNNKSRKCGVGNHWITGHQRFIKHLKDPRIKSFELIGPNVLRITVTSLGQWEGAAQANPLPGHVSTSGAMASFVLDQFLSQVGSEAPLPLPPPPQQHPQPAGGLDVSALLQQCFSNLPAPGGAACGDQGHAPEGGPVEGGDAAQPGPSDTTEKQQEPQPAQDAGAEVAAAAAAAAATQDAAVAAAAVAAAAMSAEEPAGAAQPAAPPVEASQAAAVAGPAGDQLSLLQVPAQPQASSSSAAGPAVAGAGPLVLVPLPLQALLEAASRSSLAAAAAAPSQQVEAPPAQPLLLPGGSGHSDPQTVLQLSALLQLIHAQSSADHASHAVAANAANVPLGNYPKLYDGRIHLPLALVQQHYHGVEFPHNTTVCLYINNVLVGQALAARIVKYQKHKKPTHFNYWVTGLQKTLKQYSDVRQAGVSWQGDGLQIRLVAASANH